MEDSHFEADKHWRDKSLSSLLAPGITEQPSLGHSSADDGLLLFTVPSEGSYEGEDVSACGLHWIPVSWFTDN